MKRAENLASLGNFIKTHDDLPESAKTLDTFDDMGRSAVVLAVSAMDQYFTRRFAELLVPFLKKHGATDDLVEFLEGAGFNTREALLAIGMSRPYRRIRTLVEAKFETYTTQKISVIDGLFVSIGLKDLCLRSQQKSGRAKLLVSIEDLVKRRHSIAHGGDLNKHGKLQPIDFTKLTKKLKDLRKFIECAEFIIEQRLKPTGKKATTKAAKKTVAKKKKTKRTRRSTTTA